MSFSSSQPVRFLRHLSAILFGVFCGGGAFAQLIPNGSFETASGGLPQGWSNDRAKAGPEASALYIQDGSEGGTVKTGKCGLKFQLGDGVQKCIWIMAPNEAVPVDPGAKYTLSYWVKRENFDSPGVRFMSECKGVSEKRATEYVSLGKMPALTGSCDWEKIDTEVAVPADGSVTKLILVFRMVATGKAGSDGGGAVIYVDDISLTPAP